MFHPTQGDQKALGTATGVNSRPLRVSVCAGAVLHAGYIGKRGLAAENRPYNHPGVPQQNPKAQTPTQLCLMNASRPSASMAVLMSTCLQPEASFTACSAYMQNVLVHAHARALRPGRVHVPRRAYASFCACRHAHIRAQARAQTQAHTHERTHSCSCYARTDALMRVRTRTCSNTAACTHQGVCAHAPAA